MGPGAPSADTPCGTIGGSARYVVGVCGFNSVAGSARYQLRAGRAAPLRGLSCFSSSFLPLPGSDALRALLRVLRFGFRFSGGAHSVKDCRPQGRRARPVRALCGSGSRQPPAAGAKGKPGARHEEAGGGQKPSGHKRQGAREGRKRANPLPPPASSGARPAAGGGSQNYPPTTTSRPRREGMAAEQARGRKSRQGGNGTRGPTGRGGPLAPPCGIFFAFLGGCGHPPPRIAARGPTRARSGATTAAPPLCGEGGKPGPRRTRHRRPEGALYHGAKGGGPRTGPLRAPRPGRGGTPTDTLSSPTTAGAASGAVWSEAEFGPNGITEPTPARIVRARAEGTRRRGCGGPPPRASRPEPPRRGERGSASDSPLVMLLRSST